MLSFLLMIPFRKALDLLLKHTPLLPVERCRMPPLFFPACGPPMSFLSSLHLKSNFLALTFQELVPHLIGDVSAFPTHPACQPGA